MRLSLLVLHRRFNLRVGRMTMKVIENYQVSRVVDISALLFLLLDLVVFICQKVKIRNGHFG